MPSKRSASSATALMLVIGVRYCLCTILAATPASRADERLNPREKDLIRQKATYLAHSHPVLRAIRVIDPYMARCIAHAPPQSASVPGIRLRPASSGTLSPSGYLDADAAFHWFYTSLLPFAGQRWSTRTGKWVSSALFEVLNAGCLGVNDECYSA
jgi:hypothetical protein